MGQIELFKHLLDQFGVIVFVRVSNMGQIELYKHLLDQPIMLSRIRG